MQLGALNFFTLGVVYVKCAHALPQCASALSMAKTCYMVFGGVCAFSPSQRELDATNYPASASLPRAPWAAARRLKIASWTRPLRACGSLLPHWTPLGVVNCKPDFQQPLRRNDGQSYARFGAMWASKRSTCRRMAITFFKGSSSARRQPLWNRY